MSNVVLFLPARQCSACTRPLMQHLPTNAAPASRNDVALILPACQWPHLATATAPYTCASHRKFVDVSSIPDAWHAAANTPRVKCSSQFDNARPQGPRIFMSFAWSPMSDCLPTVVAIRMTRARFYNPVWNRASTASAPPPTPHRPALYVPRAVWCGCYLVRREGAYWRRSAEPCAV